MAPTYRNETALQTAIQRKLRSLGWFVQKTHGSALSAGLPDLLALRPAGGGTCGFDPNDAERILFIEVKMPGGKLRKIQEAKIAELRGQGFEVIVARSVENVLEVVA